MSSDIKQVTRSGDNFTIGQDTVSLDLLMRCGRAHSKKIDKVQAALFALSLLLEEHANNARRFDYYGESGIASLLDMMTDSITCHQNEWWLESEVFESFQ